MVINDMATQVKEGSEITIESSRIRMIAPYIILGLFGLVFISAHDKNYGAASFLIITAITFIAMLTKSIIVVREHEYLFYHKWAIFIYGRKAVNRCPVKEIKLITQGPFDSSVEIIFSDNTVWDNMHFSPSDIPRICECFGFSVEKVIKEKTPMN
jgi:hypothetical protein